LDIPPYLSYTSGTTGQPKIIIQENHGLLCQVQDYTNDFGFFFGDRFALFNPLSFGGGSFALWGALLNGATLSIYDIKNQGLQDIPAWIKREAISVLNMPPPVFRNIFGGLAPEITLPSVRVIVLAGDTMINREIEIARQHFAPTCFLVNMLAMTEVGLVSRYIMDFQSEPGNIVPVGYPFAGVEISIVNEKGEAVPVGKEGVIQLKTRYISHDPRLNPGQIADGLFFADPGSGWCVAKSEDLGRFREDGALEHLGRKDNVVKVHGLRIDLAEVEALLYKHPSVKEATLLAMRNERFRGNQLVAYVVPQPGETPKIADIYKFLSWKLPQYMMPTRFVFLEQLPLTSNGKVDPGQLPEPDWNEPAPGQGYEKPRNPVELQLVEIWQELLDLKRVGIHDNFFALGGNSLLALQMFERIETKLHVKLPLQSLLTSPTLAEIGSLVSQSVGAPAHMTIAALRKGDDTPAIFMIPGGARTGISLVDLADRLKPGPSIYALEYPGMDGHLEPMDDIHSLASFFIKEMRSVQPTGPYHLVGPCLGGVIAFEMAQLLLTDGQEVGLLAMLDSTPPTEDMPRPRQYYRNRAANLLKRKEFGNYLSGLGGRARRKIRYFMGSKGPLGKSRLYIQLHTLWDRLRYSFHKTGHQRWLDHRLDRQTWIVFEKLQVAKKKYLPGKYPGSALVILNQLADGTMRENLWSELLGSQACYYIPGTNHRNIFSLESSLDRMAELIDGYFSSSS
jgi:acyl carrier protein